MQTKEWVYLFNELDQAMQYTKGDRDAMRGLFGGKGANLADMHRIGVPVPPEFPITTDASNAYLASGGVFQDRLWDQELQALMATEIATGKIFGDPDYPLLVSCRSGATFSMPGMMDTVLNIGLNGDAQGLIAQAHDPRFVFDAYRRLIQMFGSVMGISDEAFEKAIEHVKRKAGATRDADLTAAHWEALTIWFKTIFRSHTQVDFPQDPGGATQNGHRSGL